MYGIRNRPESEELYAKLLMIDAEFKTGSKGEKKAYARYDNVTYKVFCIWPSGSMTYWYPEIVKKAFNDKYENVYIIKN